MTTILIILASIIVYALSCISMYNYTRLAHSKNGIYSDILTTWPDLVFCFCPVGNTLWSLFWCSEYPTKRSMRKEYTFNDFFKIKS